VTTLPVVADLDGDSISEAILAFGLAYHADGSAVPGFGVQDPQLRLTSVADLTGESPLRTTRQSMA
jgi:hypothetical protein